MITLLCRPRMALRLASIGAVMVSVQACGGDSSPDAPSLVDSGAPDTGPIVTMDSGAPEEAGDAAPSTITVTGTALTNTDVPLVNAAVLVGSAAPVLTDATGHFSVAGVRAPYDLTVLISATKGVLRYEGLTRVDPSIRVPDVLLPLRQATINGGFSGATYPQGANTSTLVQFAPPSSQGATTYVTANTSFNVTWSWFGDATIVGALNAVQYTRDSAGKPVSYIGYGSIAAVAVPENSSNAVGNILMGASPGQATLTATVSLPAGYAIYEKDVQLTADGRILFDLPRDQSPDASLSYPLPRIPNGKAVVSVLAFEPNGAFTTSIKTNLAVDATNVSIGMLPAPTPALPVAAATGVTTQTSFSWTRFDGGIHAVVFVSGDSGAAKYVIFTAATETKIPDLTAAGLPLQPATAYSWLLLAFAPFASLDAFASGNPLSRLGMPERYEAQAGSRTFTTKP